MQHIILMPVGSAGDVHPFVAMALALQRRGYRVTVATNGHFQSLCERLDLPFFEIGTDEHFRSVLENSDLWKPGIKATRLILNLSLNVMRQQHDFIVDQFEPGKTAVIAGPLALGARIAQDYLSLTASQKQLAANQSHKTKFPFLGPLKAVLPEFLGGYQEKIRSSWKPGDQEQLPGDAAARGDGLPMATVQLAPCVFLSCEKPPRLPGLIMPTWLPHGIKSWIWRASDSAIDYMVLPKLNAFRAELGLKKTSRIIGRWWNSPQLILAMFPEWFGLPASDWPSQVRLTGFGLFDESDGSSLDTEILDFCEGGSHRPVVFTPGSANIHGRVFFKTSIEVCRKLGRRAIFLTRHPQQLPCSLPDHVRHFDFVPLSQLLPHCDALVYHGGIGTLSQACAAGVSHLIVKLAHDQFDNAQRIERLGLGTSLKPSQYTVRRATATLGRLLNDPLVAQRCQEIAGRFGSHDGIEEACDLFEKECL